MSGKVLSVGCHQLDTRQPDSDKAEVRDFLMRPVPETSVVAETSMIAETNMVAETSMIAETSMVAETSMGMIIAPVAVIVLLECCDVLDHSVGVDYKCGCGL